MVCVQNFSSNKQILTNWENMARSRKRYIFKKTSTISASNGVYGMEKIFFKYYFLHEIKIFVKPISDILSREWDKKMGGVIQRYILTFLVDSKRFFVIIFDWGPKSKIGSTKNFVWYLSTIWGLLNWNFMYDIRDRNILNFLKNDR